MDPSGLRIRIRPCSESRNIRPGASRERQERGGSGRCINSQLPLLLLLTWTVWAAQGGGPFPRAEASVFHSDGSPYQRGRLALVAKVQQSPKIQQAPKGTKFGLSPSEFQAMNSRLQQAPEAKLQTPATCTLTVGPTSPYKKVQDAVDKVGTNPATNPVTICVEAGTYHETVTIQKGQDGITLMGQGFTTRIVADKSLSQVHNTYLAATLIVWGNFFIARNIMIQNTLKTTTDPAPAVSILSARTGWASVSLTAWQDTVSIYTGNHSFANSFIAGIVDTTWGNGRAAFVTSTIFSRTLNDPSVPYPGQVATYGTDVSSDGVTAGAVFWNCTIGGDGKTYLGRPYRPQAVVVYAFCYMGPGVEADGYMDRRNYLEMNEYVYLEYGSYGPGAAAKRKYGKVLAGSPPLAFTPRQFLGIH